MEEEKVILQCADRERIVFHFNKASIGNKDIPMWTIKHKGNTYYVDHVDSEIGFSTKETPDNEHTQGSIMFRGGLNIFEDANGKKRADIWETR